MNKQIRVIDTRTKQFFVTDDVFLNGYAKHLGPTASMVYISLCRHASKDQTAFPSQQLIAEEINASVRTVVSKIAILEEWGLISIERNRKNGGQWLRNDYTLLDKSAWKKPPSATIAHGDDQVQITAFNQVQPLHTKYTHTNMKYTHISLSSKNKKINEISQDFKEDLADRFNVPISFVESKLDDLQTWCQAKGKTYKDYGAALRNWVKKDALKIIEKNHDKRSNQNKYGVTKV